MMMHVHVSSLFWSHLAVVGITMAVMLIVPVIRGK